MAVALAVCGDRARAQSLAAAIRAQSPQGTLSNAVGIPSIEAALELNRNKAERAVELLRPAAGYDRTRALPVYLRGLACLRAGQGAEAAAEFQRILDHPGAYAMDQMTPPCNIAWDADARLGLARAAALARDFPRVRKAYEDLFSRWKDADQGFPPLWQARSEYARLPRTPRPVTPRPRTPRPLTPDP